MAAAITLDYFITNHENKNPKMENNERKKEKIERALRELSEERAKIKTPKNCHPRCFWCRSEKSNCHCKCGGKYHGQGWKLLEDMNQLEKRLENLLEKYEEKEVTA
ncbi:hypothetical protein CW705_04530 [Candidatus Bathyarchaeota archaeon]|nr:MAG: hypothetical protein CW705_04530 [Candidatus Bathyarchaeota archaeon]